MSQYVIRGLRTNLLGLTAITTLKLVTRIDATSSTEQQDWLAQYPSLFKGLGNLGDEYSIKLFEGAQPHGLFTPQKVPIPMRAKVKEELDRMEKAGVISKVAEATPWCARMVVVPKQGRAVIVCVDLKGLNENVLRLTRFQEYTTHLLNRQDQLYSARLTLIGILADSAV